MNPLPVLVIGAGCTGLAIAQGLSKAKIPCIVFERDESLPARPRDWNMGLHWGALALVKIVPAAEPFLQSSQSLSDAARSFFQPLQVDPSTPCTEEDNLYFTNGKTGKIMGAVPAKDFYRLQRSKLRKELIKNVDVRFGKYLKDLSLGQDEHGRDVVTAIFRDGTQETGCLVVGADGGHSRVKSFLVGDEAAAAQRLPFSVTIVQATYTKEQAEYLRSFHPLYYASSHPDNKMAWFGLQEIVDPNDPETWLFHFYVSWPTTFDQQDAEERYFGDKERLAQLRAHAATFADPWKSASEWMKGDERPWHFKLGVWDPSLPEHAWSNHGGRVTLAGDAAHLMTFQRGQGLNHSLTDAAALVERIKSFMSTSVTETERQGQKDAIDAYETEMKARAGKEVRVSTLNTTMLHDWGKVQQSPVFNGGMAKDVKTSVEAGA